MLVFLQTDSGERRISPFNAEGISHFSPEKDADSGTRVLYLTTGSCTEDPLQHQVKVDEALKQISNLPAVKEALQYGWIQGVEAVCSEKGSLSENVRVKT